MIVVGTASSTGSAGWGAPTTGSPLSRASTSGKRTSPFTPATLVRFDGQGIAADTLGGKVDVFAGLRQAVHGGVAPADTPAHPQAAAHGRALKAGFERLEGGDASGAAQVFEAVLAENPRHAVAVQGLGHVEMSRRRYAEAERLFQKAHAMDGQAGYDHDVRNARILQRSDEDVFRQARALLAAPAQQQEGVRLLVALTERNGEHTAAQIALGDALLRQGDPLNGLLQYGNAVRSAQPDQLRQLETKLTELARRSQNSAFLQQLVGRIYLRQTRFDAAATAFQQSAQQAGTEAGVRRDLATAYVGLGREALERGELARAHTHLNRARDLDPGYAEARRVQGETYLAQAEQQATRGRYDQAAQEYRRAADLLSGAPETLRARVARGAYSAGRVLQSRREARAGEINAELVAYQVAYDMARDNRTYKETLANARLAQGEQLEARGKLREATAAYLRAADLYPQQATYRQRAIDTLVVFGTQQQAHLFFDNAVDAFRQAFRLDPQNAALRQQLASAYHARGQDLLELGRTPLARSDFREALHLFPDNEAYRASYLLAGGTDGA
ncbi:MAG: tetratricopeptide repeat protein [Phycisphaerales bacterium]|nr:tetratricopeptide repeat protein [Phycisphaerales bacterium]